MIIVITSILFPLVSLSCVVWISFAMVSYIAEIQRDIKATKQVK